MKCPRCTHRFKLTTYLSSTAHDIEVYCERCHTEFFTPRYALVWKQDPFGNRYCSLMDLLKPDTDFEDFKYYELL